MKLTPAKAMEIQFRIQGRMAAHGVRIRFDGVTDVPQRWEIIRGTIVSMGLANVAIGKRAGGARETYAQVYQRLTGAPVTPTQEALTLA
jgi:hypothetical protein